MSEGGRKFHSLETIGRLKSVALSTHDEIQDGPESIGRRDLMKLMAGASAALALGVTGCERKPKRKIISRPTGPEYQKPGKALYYSSTWTEGPLPYGIMIKTVDGRPVKIEGNPEHPVNRGASDAAMQASILSLYDPDRLRNPIVDGKKASWEDADAKVAAALQGAGSVVLITPSTLGPSERALISEFLSVAKTAKHLVFEPVNDAPRRSAWKKAYGSDGEVLPRYDKARVILSLDADFLGTDGPILESIRLFAEGRKLEDAQHKSAQMSRLYVAESSMTLTGSNADHRLALRPSKIQALAEALLAAVNGDEKPLTALGSGDTKTASFLKGLAEDLKANKGQALVVAGAQHPESVHGAVALLNDALEASGKTLNWNPAPATLPVSSNKAIETALKAAPDVLICWNVNPVYAWSGEGFADLISKAKLTVAHGSHEDETLSACAVALPSSHNLESWNDAAPRDGILNLGQPVIAPLFDTRQPAESLLKWTQALSADTSEIRKARDWHQYLQKRWKQRLAPQADADAIRAAQRAWEQSLRVGGTFAPKNTPLPALNQAAARSAITPAKGGEGTELVVRPHHGVQDGRYANVGWLQELPDPVSKLVWDNAASISPAAASKLGASEGDLIKVTAAGASVELPVLVQPGAPDDVVSLTLGHGRTAGGVVAKEAGGARVSSLLGADGSRIEGGAQVALSGGKKKLVRTQKEFDMHGRPIVLDGTLNEFHHDAAFVKHKGAHHPEAELNKPWDFSKGPKWGMAIDLNRCIGCSACMTACQAENNIPIVGRDECAVGREMHWMRIDRYEDKEKVHHQPMLCQHCDDAPCEIVCPVNATTHSPDGLNEMTYNRCVGTRYCANNCPYKVRRFNFFRYQEAQLRDPVQELMFNPQVTVRGIGVMEKCTFCVQRINEAKFKATNKGEDVKADAVQPACAQACPASAIVFGNVNDKNHPVTEVHKGKRAFHVLEELNIKPNVTYLAKVRNPNAKEEQAPGGGHKKEGHA